MFDYERETRRFYEDAAVARAYHESFTRPGGWQGLRFAFIARRERRAVAAFLRRVPAKRVIDIPTGTGKMAPLLTGGTDHVLACDVSEHMLAIARETYFESGMEDVAFQVVDLASASSAITEPYDLTICVRLMHRVPKDVRRRMLREIAMLTPHAIVSFAIESPYQRLRRELRRLVFGGADIGVETRPGRAELDSMLGESFEVMAKMPIARGLSSEWMYLLRSSPSRPDG